MDERIIRKAKARVRKKKGFYMHFAVFISVGIFFFLMNMFTMDGNEELWFFFPLLPWSIGLMIHYAIVFGFPGSKILSEDWEETEVAKEIVRIKQEIYGKSAEQPMNEEMEEKLPLKEMEKLKGKRWDENEIV